MSIGRLLWVMLLLSGLAVQPAAGEPMDVGNAEPRWVTVQFEVSPDDPGQRDTVYTQPLPARLESDPATGWVRVTVAGPVVERYLLAREDPVEGSFSDFVWTFDPQTGEVLSAEMTGIVRRRLRWGIFESSAEAEIRVHMSTRTAAGFKRPRRLLGQVLYRYCRPSDDAGCRPVRAERYDPASGTVNAIGRISARSGGIRTLTFSPLGEARFAELPSLAAESASPARPAR